MPLNINFLEKSFRQMGITKGEVAEKLEMTREGFSRSVKNNKLQADKIELLATLLHVTVSTIFGEEERNVAVTNESEKIKIIERLLASKDHEIHTLKKMVAMLERNQGLE